MKKRILFLLCLILFVVSVAGVSAADDVNQTVDDTLSVSAIDNVDQTNDAISVSENVDELSAKDDGTFTALQKKIDNAAAGSIITLENDYKYDDGFGTDGIYEGIYISKSLTIDGNGNKIDGLGQSRIFKIVGNNVALKNMNILNGYHDEDGAIYIDGNNCLLMNCNFINNTANPNSHSYVYNGYTYYTNVAAYGGAIYCLGSGCKVWDCNFINNTAETNGGAIHCNGIDGHIKNCNFDNNYENAVSVRGPYLIENSNFTNNLGAIDVYGPQVTINDCIFSENYGYDGAAIYIDGDDATVSDCMFRDNTASPRSYGNYPDGGAILWEGENGILVNSTFINNTVRGSYSLNSISRGGAVNWLGKYGILTNCDFIDNRAEMGNGGAVYWMGSYGALTNSSFSNNYADTGGAIYLADSSAVRNSDFTENIAEYGGAIYNYYGNNNVSDCNFVSNSNSAIEFSKKLSGETSFTNLEYYNLNFDKINDYTGGIYVKDDCLVIEGNYKTVFISGNVLVDISGKKYEETFDSKGNAAIRLDDVPSGVHNAKISYSGDEKFGAFEINVPITIESSTKLDVPDVTKNYGGSESLQITLTESGAPVSNAKVSISINGGAYTRTTDSNGKASMPINLNAGSYDAVVSYGDVSATAKVTVNQLSTKTTLTSAKNGHDSVTLTASVDPSDVSGDVVFNVNGKEYGAKVSDSKASYALKGLAVGSYDAKATYNGDVNHKSSSSGNVKFTIEEYSVVVDAPDVTKYYGGSERFYVTVKDNSGNPISGAGVKISINSQTYDKITGSDGRTSIGLNLPKGTYKASVEYDGSTSYSTVTIKSTISADDISMMFKDGTRYVVSVSEGSKALANINIGLNINGVLYDRTTNAAGTSSLAINLDPGEYIITAERKDTGEKYSSNIVIKSLFAENNDVDMFFRNGSGYAVKIIKQDGKVAGAGEKVRFNINGVFYERTTNDQGIARLNLNLEPKDYIITAEYKDCRVSNNIHIKPVLTGSDLTKQFGDITPFSAKLVDGKGAPAIGKTITFNINGVFYNRTTDLLGIARLNINLLPAQYIITSMYENGAVTSNKVTIASILG